MPKKLNPPIGRFMFRSTTNRGDLCKTRVSVQSDGTVCIDKFVLTSKVRVERMRRVKKAFGKSLYESRVGFKLNSFALIYKNVLQILIDNKVSI